jgi:hypothetical protein
VTVELVYCEGWDPTTRAPARPLPEATARDRDAAGDQYAVVLTGDRPLVVVEVCWAARHAAVWYLDEQGRRDRKLVFRRWPDERLVLLETRQWAYGPETAEFHGDEPDWRIPFWRAKYEPDGSRKVSTANWDGPGMDVERSHPVPAFGDWTAVTGVGPATTREDPPPAAPLDESPWRPPLPCRPRQLDATFSDGAGFELDGGRATVELAPGGLLRLPTGRLVVADPDPWMHEVTPFAETVPPGEYPLQLSVVRFADTPDHTRVAACAVWVSDHPTAWWDNAWRTGEEPLLLGDGEFFGVGVDAGRVALVDAAAAAAFGETVEDAYDELTGWAHELTGDGDADANLITVESGWGDGSYPVWVGRDAAGELTCFVVDFLLLAHADRLD